MTQSCLLDIKNLHVRFPVGTKTAHIVKGVDLHVKRGEILGVIGESGSGKTITGLALLRLLPEAAVIEADQILFDGINFLQLKRSEFDKLRGVRIAMIFQDPATSFNPVKTIAWHFREIYERKAIAENKSCPADWYKQAEAILLDVGIVRAAEIMSVYTHQVSGGMLQRVLIALVLALSPDFIIADEPTTNLDKIVEKQVLQLFRDMQQKLNAAMVFITHDMDVAASLCNRISVMYGGQVVESGNTHDVFNNPKHPYTEGLVTTAKALSEGSNMRLPELSGAPPSPTEIINGCPFYERCGKRMDICNLSAPDVISFNQHHYAKCFLYSNGNCNE